MINRLFLKICSFLATIHHCLLTDSGIQLPLCIHILRIRMSLLTVSWALVPAVSICVGQGKLGSLRWKFMTLETRCLISTAGCIKSIAFAWVMFSES